MDGVYLTIEDKWSLIHFLKGAVRNGYLRRLDLREVNEYVQRVEYPIRITVDLDSILGVGKNAVVKGVFGKIIDKGLTEYLEKAMKAGL